LVEERSDLTSFATDEWRVNVLDVRKKLSNIKKRHQRLLNNDPNDLTSSSTYETEGEETFGSFLEDGADSSTPRKKGRFDFKEPYQRPSPPKINSAVTPPSIDIGHNQG